MIRRVCLGALVAGVSATGAVSAGTLEAVRERGELYCGLSNTLVGFAAQDSNGAWQGFDVAICRAVAAAVLGDPTKVAFMPIAGANPFDKLAAGEVDLLARNAVWTFSNDAGRDADFAGITYYDGQGFMVRKEHGISSAKELNGATVCYVADSAAGRNAAGYFKTNSLSMTPVEVATLAEGEKKFIEGECKAITTDSSVLAATRAIFPNPGDFVILPEIISKEPRGPVVHQGEDDWGDVVRWTVNALVAGEELGVTSTNIEELAKGTENPEINRILGGEGNLGEMLGLDANWAKKALSASGNYGEIFDKTIGEATPIGLARGLNAQWIQGGLLYAPPFR